MRNSEYRVTVSGWSTSRTLIEDGERGKIMLEIALSHNHCPTCAARVRHVTSALAAKNIRYDWEYPGGSKSFIVLDHPGHVSNIPGYLGSVLDLSIRS